MANQEHIEILNRGVEAWNAWRQTNPSMIPNLSNANLRRANLPGVDFDYANLEYADLTYAVLSEAGLIGAKLNGATLVEAQLPKAELMTAKLSEVNLSNANLDGADLSRADIVNANLKKANFYEARLNLTNLSNSDLSEGNFGGANLRNSFFTGANLHKAKLIAADLTLANLEGADLRDAILSEANLRLAILKNANLEGANLGGTGLVEANLEGANLNYCYVYGISAWGVNLKNAIQSNLTITPRNEPEITVDNLKVAQFIYLLLNNSEIGNAIETIGKKAVLILGRFTEERKAILDAIRDELRKRDYLPIVFDFDKPANRDLTETIITLAGMSRFVIADLSDPHSIPHELMSFAEKLPNVPVKPIFCAVEAHPRPYPMLEHFRHYHWVLPVYDYNDEQQLLASLTENVIEPAEAKVKELRAGK